MYMSDIEYYPDYKIDEYGSIDSYRNGYRRLKPQLSHDGYLRIDLCNDSGGRRRYFIHRLVAKTFMPYFDKSMQVNHIDGNKLNNHISNLELTTDKDNKKHAVLVVRAPIEQRLSRLREAKLLQNDIGGTITDCLKWLGGLK